MAQDIDSGVGSLNKTNNVHLYVEYMCHIEFPNIIFTAEFFVLHQELRRRGVEAAVIVVRSQLGKT